MFYLTTRRVLIGVAITAIFAVPILSQVRPVYDQGALGLMQLVKRLNTSASVMMIGAHPDDEDTALLAYFARGENARTAYLSLTRGDGGQNIIGPEQGEALGVIRTEELLQARKLDGAEQYFARAYDYGFSKTLAEAKQKWPEDIVLCDVVEAIRKFRPLVVISRFSGTPADGHGQHQYAGYITPLAVAAAGDIGKCTSAGAPWKVQKLYFEQGFRSTTEPKLRINTGEFDPILGRSYHEIAREARGLHRSQDQGSIELKGPQFSGLNLVGSDAKENGAFDGIDIAVQGIAGNTQNREAAFGERLRKVQEIVSEIDKQYDPRNPEKILSLLVQGYGAAYDAEWSTRMPTSKGELQVKEKQFLDAIKAAAGIQIDAIADRETVGAGEAFKTTVRVFSAVPDRVSIKTTDIATSGAWQVSPGEKTAEQNSFSRETATFEAVFNIRPQGASVTQPYWLERQREGDLFSWSNGDFQTLPFASPILSAKITSEIDGRRIEFNVPVEYRFADVRGEVRRELNVVPTLTLDLDHRLLVVPASKAETRKISVSVTNNAPNEIAGRISLDTGNAFKVTDNAKAFSLKRKGEKASFEFEIMIPANRQPGEYRIVAGASTMSPGAKDPTVYSSSMQRIEYPHIQTHRLYSAADVRVRVVDLAVEPVRVGYIMGSGDKVTDAIEQIGLTPELLDENDIAASDLSRFDAIVVGIRAYQVRPDLVANNQRLLDYARNGGTLIVQYQTPEYARQGLLPFPAEIGPRVADENAVLTILQSEHPILTSPNKLSADDFRGWVQERNLNDLTKMDPNYVGLLESHDVGEDLNTGGLVVANIGKGRYIYCSYSLFRQLPAGIPGAYRLLANILSFSKLKK
jgi:LmbE family N-acetylglucosaminyl deacetylase